MHAFMNALVDESGFMFRKMKHECLIKVILAKAPSY